MPKETQKILILGAAGFVGQQLTSSFAEKEDYRVLAAIRERDVNFFPPEIETQILDLKSLGQIRETLRQESPEVIINSAGLVGFKDCQADPELAVAVNSRAVQDLVDAALGLPNRPVLVQISTDAVFAGRRGGNYKESDQRRPASVYGKTKQEGEMHVAGSEPLSKYRLAAEIADIFGLDGQLVVPTKRSVQANLSMYPGDTSLDVSKLSATGFTPMKVSEGLRELQTVSV